MKRRKLPWGERLLSSLYRFRFARRLSFKLSMIIIWLGLGTIFLMTIYFLEHEKEILHRELEKRGLHIAHMLALQAVDPILTDDRYALYERLKVITSLPADQAEQLVEYAQVLNPQGEVLAFRQIFSSRHDPDADPLPVARLKSQEPMVRERDGSLLDISVPIRLRGETIGLARVGITKKYLEHTLGRVQLKILLSILSIVAGGIFLGIWLTQKIVRPLKSLTEGAYRVGQGDFGHVVQVPSQDEIGELTQTFNQMSARLASSVEEIQETQQRLLQSEKLSALGQLSAGLAHELKNPLTSIKMIVEAMREDPQDNPATDLEILLKEAQHMDEILTRFLEFARPARLHRQEVALGPMVEEVLELLRRELEEGGIAAEAAVSPHLPLLWADRGKIKQALMNLVLNARQAMPAGGRLKIWAEPDGHPGRIALHVEDSGSGIQPPAMDRIFDPFYTTKENGVGLGLSIVYAVIKEHGGNITVRSEPGRWTRFSILLPGGEKESHAPHSHCG